MPISPFADNPLRTRADLQEAVRALVVPLGPRFSPGAARVRLGASGAHFDDHAAELEGFARPLWGLVPLAAGGGSFDGWERYQRGLANGSDPQHAEYWGDPRDYDQRLVEMAAIGSGAGADTRSMSGSRSIRARKSSWRAGLARSTRCRWSTTTGCSFG